MRVIGITGGVGAGKSEVITYLNEVSRSTIIKADNVAHELEKKGMPAYTELVELLGDSILGEDSEIDKKRFAEKIFSDNDILDKVNSIIHPLVKKYILSTIDKEKNSGNKDFVFIEAALLIEDGYIDICDELWYVYASEDVRRDRLKAVRGYSDSKIDSIFNSQSSEDIFKKYCNKVINNNGSIEQMKESVNSLLKEY